ncbi:MAG: HEPN domain-containing protein [Fibrobacterota bacterium]|nr:HEPN domain-containing protein [Fibrobacterota bacterium]QQS06048.1 MAG: HEPN domain-containing protein [Fibrobacterota bacterium]
MADYPKAAEKNLADAAVLLEKGRWDGAAYHAGFVVECTLNALLVANGGSTSLGHKLSQLETYITSSAKGPRARRLSPTQSQILGNARIQRWNPTGIRYEAEFVHDAIVAKTWYQAAKQFYHSVKP